MATKKQVQAAKRNVRKAQQGAKKKRTIAHLPKSTRRELGKQAARGRSRGGKPGPRSRTGTASSSTRSRNRRASPAARGWEVGLDRRDQEVGLAGPNKRRVLLNVGASRRYFFDVLSLAGLAPGAGPAGGGFSSVTSFLPAA